MVDKIANLSQNCSRSLPLAPPIYVSRDSIPYSAEFWQGNCVGFYGYGKYTKICPLKHFALYSASCWLLTGGILVGHPIGRAKQRYEHARTLSAVCGPPYHVTLQYSFSTDMISAGLISLIHYHQTTSIVFNGRFHPSDNLIISNGFI